MTFIEFKNKIASAGLPDIVQAAEKECGEDTIRLPFELMSRLLDQRSVVEVAGLLSVVMQADAVSGVIALFEELRNVESRIIKYLGYAAEGSE